MTIGIISYDRYLSRAAPRDRRWLVVGILLAAAFFFQYFLILNSDLGWLLTACEKILDGGRFGVDVFESNPPLSLYMYMPAVLLGRALNWAPENLVLGLVLIEIAGALALIDRGAAKAGISDPERDATTWALAFLLALLAGKVFGQREHIAVIALTPFVAVTSFRWRGASPGRTAIAVGLCAGLGMCIKPYFAFAVGAPLLAGALRGRSLQPLFVAEALVAAVVVVVYAAGVVWLFPAYVFDYVPMVRAAYVPIRESLGALAIAPAAVLAASAMMLRLVSDRDQKAWGRAIPWAAAAAGGLASYIAQGKGWTYTAFALVTFALAPSLIQLGTTRLRAAPAVAIAAALGMIGYYLVSEPNGFPVLTRHVAALADSPRVLTITDDIGVGHPLVRQLHGTWVGETCAQLLSGGAIWLARTTRLSDAGKVELDKVVAFERSLLLKALVEGRPDVVLADERLFSRTPFDWLAWAKEDPAIRAELEHYREVEDVGHVRILVRQP